MTHEEVLDAIFEVTETTGGRVSFWIDPDGVFHDDPCLEETELTCCCTVSNETHDGTWIVTPWLYNDDCAAIFKTASSARNLACFWMEWMERLYGSEACERSFDTDWLEIKSNRSLLMMLFCREGEELKKELWAKERADSSNIKEIG